MCFTKVRHFYILDHLCYFYILFFIGMGRRRIRFSSFKNEERKKRNALSLVVSIRRDPIHAYGMSVASFNPVESVPDPEASQDLSLPVSLPISFDWEFFMLWRQIRAVSLEEDSRSYLLSLSHG